MEAPKERLLKGFCSYVHWIALSITYHLHLKAVFKLSSIFPIHYCLLSSCLTMWRVSPNQSNKMYSSTSKAFPDHRSIMAHWASLLKSLSNRSWLDLSHSKSVDSNTTAATPLYFSLCSLWRVQALMITFTWKKHTPTRVTFYLFNWIM